MALIVAMMALLMLSALGAAVVLTTSSETLISANYRNSVEAMYAADAMLERVMGELVAVNDWSTLLGGTVHSTFADGGSSGPRRLADGSTIDLTHIRNMANCGKVTECSAADLIGNATGDRPWARNNPVWQMFAYGNLAAMMPAGSISSLYYVILMIADDPSENDGDPTRDGVDATNPGSGVLALRAEAYGPRAGHKVIEVTVSRRDETPPGNNGIGRAAVRVLSWREVR